jgi:flagellar protein FlgJ
MSESAGLGGIQSPNMAGFEARLQAAQMGRLDAEVKQAAGAVDKLRTETAGSAKMEPKEAARLQKVSRDFESIFLAYMLKTMRQSVDKGGLMGESQGEEIFGEMRDEEFSKGMANAGGIGLGRLLMDQLKQSLKTSA